MIPDTINNLMSQQAGQVKRFSSEIEKVHECLRSLGVYEHEQLKEFFCQYKLSGILSNRSVELLDLCSPSPQIEEATDFGRDTYDITDDFICLTSGEGDGFLLYSKLDRKVYDISVSELDSLEAGDTECRWESFYDLIEWSLDAGGLP